MWNLKSRGAHILIPLFYNVAPSDVRHGLGSYAEAFNKHRSASRYNCDRIEEWRDVLRKVSGLSGWFLETTSSGYEGKLVKQVVKDVLQTLDFGMQEVAEHPVGLEPFIEEVRQLCKLGDQTGDRLTLGIWGIGGLGKTNLSKAIYNEIRHDFDASCFVSNVKDSSHRSVIQLQQQILMDLLKTKIELKDIDHGKVVMRSSLASLKALVVLDDVDNEEQLDALMGNWFGNGSRIIITTRNRRVLDLRQVDELYSMKKLEFAEAKELFCWHAFRRKHPKIGYENMTDRIVEICSGLPSALKIIGTDLYIRDKTCWREVLDKLENAGHDVVFEALKISYDKLAHEEKHIFLDIACFFVEINSSDFIQNRAFSRDFYVRFWSAFGCKSVITSLEILKEKALIVMQEHRSIEPIVEEDNRGQFLLEFSMHDQIRDMGRRIVLEESRNDPSKRSRVWRKEDLRTLIAATTIQENSNVEGVMWRRRMELQQLDTLAPLQKLGFSLCWELQVETVIKRLPPNLKYLVLSDCRLKDYNHEMAGTETGSDLNGSPVLSSIVPKSIAGIESGGDWKVDLILCWDSQVKMKMKRLARNLKHLVLSKCQSAQSDSQMTENSSGRGDNGSSVPPEFPVLSPVLPEFLVLSPVLPESIAQLKYLQFLDMSGTKQTCLPEQICELHCLEELYLSRCSLKALPKAFGNLSKLKFLDVSNNFLSEFPPSFEYLQSLVNLQMSWNEQLVVFPALPKGLTALNARGCSKLQAISLQNAMKFLKTVDLSDCECLTALPRLVGWKSLRDLRLDGCKQLAKLDRLPESVISLRASGCPKLKEIFFNVPSIEVELNSSSGGTFFRPGTAYVKELCMIGCDNIRLNIYRLLEDFPSLERLDLSLSSEAVGGSQPLVGQKNLTLQSEFVCVAAFFCFEVESEENAHLPKIDVLMTYLDDSLFSEIFEVPSCMKGNDNRRFIRRVCIWRRRFSKGGTASCSYSVHGSRVILKQVEFINLEEKAKSEKATNFLEQWKLLSSSNDIHRHRDNTDYNSDDTNYNRVESSGSILGRLASCFATSH